ncbi:MAG: lysine 5,6-aminomutase subunit alpha TIM-barrel domain-containing protein [Thermodesulfobacteriota bacterium]
MGELNLSEAEVGRAREAAARIAADTLAEIEGKTTVAVERAVLRLLGVEGVTQDGVPWSNVVVDDLLSRDLLDKGAAVWFVRARTADGGSPEDTARRMVRGEVDYGSLPRVEPEDLRGRMRSLAREGLDRIDRSRSVREERLAELGRGREPLRYLIVATGDIHEDAIQARAAARGGADIIAVIRHTAQSLLDYVPEDGSIQGVGGTIANRGNFRVMREALDEVSEELGRYIFLTNYCSGLCMPEMAVLGAQERLDVMLNDSMYGVIFRDINMVRTFIDQHFSRALLARAGMMINTGEDNYLTTSDAFEKAHTVLASQFINEQFALKSGLAPGQIGLGHAFEISPKLEDSFLFELAQAQMVRQIFADCPVKYMPPTKYMTGNIFQGNVQNALFNAVSVLTDQSVHLLGMPTEALHTPHVHDRHLSLENVDYVFRAIRHLGEDIVFRPGGRIETRASNVLDKAVDMLEEIAGMGLMQAISEAMFADIARTREGGKGLEGVVAKAGDYCNPIAELLWEERALS